MNWIFLAALVHSIKMVWLSWGQDGTVIMGSMILVNIHHQWRNDLSEVQQLKHDKTYHTGAKRSRCYDYHGAMIQISWFHDYCPILHCCDNLILTNALNTHLQLLKIKIGISAFLSLDLLTHMARRKWSTCPRYADWFLVSHPKYSLIFRTIP